MLRRFQGEWHTRALPNTVGSFHALLKNGCPRFHFLRSYRKPACRRGDRGTDRPAHQHRIPLPYRSPLPLATSALPVSSGIRRQHVLQCRALTRPVRFSLPACASLICQYQSTDQIASWGKSASATPAEKISLCVRDVVSSASLRCLRRTSRRRPAGSGRNGLFGYGS